MRVEAQHHENKTKGVKRSYSAQEFYQESKYTEGLRSWFVIGNSKEIRNSRAVQPLGMTAQLLGMTT